MNTETKETEPQHKDQKPNSDLKDFQTTLWESHIKISDPESGEILLNQRD